MSLSFNSYRGAEVFGAAVLAVMVSSAGTSHAQRVVDDGEVFVVDGERVVQRSSLVVGGDGGGTVRVLNSGQLEVDGDGRLDDNGRIEVDGAGSVLEFDGNVFDDGAARRSR